MKTKIPILLILFLTMGTTAWSSSPPWTGDGVYTFSDADPFFMENGISDTATVNIIGGEFGVLHCYDESTVNIMGGIADRIRGYNYSKIYLKGGSINKIAGFDNAEIFLWVDYCNIDFNTYIGYDARLTGVWLGGNGEFDILVREDSYPHVTIIPEPSFFLLLTTGMILLRNKIRIPNK